MENSKFEAFKESIRQVLQDQFEASPELKAEFLSGDDYAAFTLATAGREYLADWRHRLATEDNEAAYQKAVAAGYVHNGAVLVQ